MDIRGDLTPNPRGMTIQNPKHSTELVDMDVSYTTVSSVGK